MNHEHDETIRRALQDLRDADESSVPDFVAVQERARRQYRFDTRRAVSMALAASVVLVTGSVMVREATKTPTRLVVPAEVIALSNWRPMTDALLEGLPDATDDAALTASLLPIVRLDTTPERTP